jgi:hypothetical protein
MRSNIVIVRITAISMLFCRIAFAGDASAVEKSEKAPLFAFGGIGVAHITADGEIAFHSVFESRSGEADFLRLLNDGNAVSTSDGLCRHCPPSVPHVMGSKWSDATMLSRAGVLGAVIGHVVWIGRAEA